MTQPSSKEPERLRVYQQWQGNERFFCHGRVMAGPNWKAPFGSALLIVGPTPVFLAFPATYLMINVHPVIMVFGCILPVLSLLFLFMTAFCDPGVIPRQEPDEEFLAGRKPRTKEVMVNEHRVVIRYNDTCHFYQPPRAHHCSVNDNCIERFDHHCPWVGTTIGRRNYRTFLLFVYTTTVLCLYVMGCSLAQLFLVHNTAKAAGYPPTEPWGSDPKEYIPALVLLGFTFLFLWFVGGLSAFHCYLVGTNQTTYENFRYNHDNRANPYNVGLMRNCLEVWCTRIPASQVKVRMYADEQRRAARAAAAASGGGQAVAGPLGGGGSDEDTSNQNSSHDGNGAGHHLEHEMSRLSAAESQHSRSYPPSPSRGGGAGLGTVAAVAPVSPQLAHTLSNQESDYATPYTSQHMQGVHGRADGGSPVGRAEGSVVMMGSGMGNGSRYGSGGGIGSGSPMAAAALAHGGEGSGSLPERTSPVYQSPLYQTTQPQHLQRWQQQQQQQHTDAQLGPPASPGVVRSVHSSEIDLKVPPGGGSVRLPAGPL